MWDSHPHQAELSSDAYLNPSLLHLYCYIFALFSHDSFEAFGMECVECVGQTSFCDVL